MKSQSNVVVNFRCKMCFFGLRRFSSPPVAFVMLDSIVKICSLINSRVLHAYIIAVCCMSCCSFAADQLQSSIEAILEVELIHITVAALMPARRGLTGTILDSQRWNAGEWHEVSLELLYGRTKFVEVCQGISILREALACGFVRIAVRFNSVLSWEDRFDLKLIAPSFLTISTLSVQVLWRLRERCTERGTSDKLV